MESYPRAAVERAMKIQRRYTGRSQALRGPSTFLAVQEFSKIRPHDTRTEKSSVGICMDASNFPIRNLISLVPLSKHTQLLALIYFHGHQKRKGGEPGLLASLLFPFRGIRLA